MLGSGSGPSAAIYCPHFVLTLYKEFWSSMHLHCYGYTCILTAPLLIETILFSISMDLFWRRGFNVDTAIYVATVTPILCDNPWGQMTPILNMKVIGLVFFLKIVKPRLNFLPHTTEPNESLMIESFDPKNCHKIGSSSIAMLSVLSHGFSTPLVSRCFFVPSHFHFSFSSSCF